MEHVLSVHSLQSLGYHIKRVSAEVFRVDLVTVEDQVCEVATIHDLQKDGDTIAEIKNVLAGDNV